MPLALSLPRTRHFYTPKHAQTHHRSRTKSHVVESAASSAAAPPWTTHSWEWQGHSINFVVCSSPPSSARPISLQLSQF